MNKQEIIDKVLKKKRYKNVYPYNKNMTFIEFYGDKVRNEVILILAEAIDLTEQSSRQRFKDIIDSKWRIDRIWGDPEYIKDDGTVGDYNTGHWTGRYINPFYVLIDTSKSDYLSEKREVYRNKDFNKVLDKAEEELKNQLGEK